MREAGKKKKETQLPHLWNPHKSKKSDKMKLRYKISIWVALALAGSLLWGGSVWLWLVGICAGKFLIRLLLTITLAIAVYILAYALIIGAILWLLIFLNRQIYEKKKQDNRTAMQILRSGQHLRVYGIGLPQQKYIRLWGTIQGTQSEG